MEVKLELIYLLEEICQSLSGDIHMVQSRSSLCLSSQETDEQATACTAVFSLFFQIYRSHITVTLFTVTFYSVAFAMCLPAADFGLVTRDRCRGCADT